MVDKISDVKAKSENAHPADGNGAGSLADRVRSLRLGGTQAGPRPRASRLPWLLCLVLLAACAYMGYRLKSEQPPPAEQTAAPEASTANDPPPASVSRVALEAGGYIIPVHRVQVAPKVGGEVEALFIDEGQFVKKGERLAKLDPTKYRFEYQRTEALVQQAKADYEKMKAGNRQEEKRQARAALLEAEEQRVQTLDQAQRLRRLGSAASPEELFRIESQLSAAVQKVEQLRQMDKMMQEGFRKEDVDRAKHTYDLAVAQRDNAKYDLDNTDVLAPVTGIILAKHAEVGNTVRPEAFSNGLSASLCDMADLSELEVDVDVSERDLMSVFKGQKCEIRTEAFPQIAHKGYVSRLMPEADKSKASVSVRVRIDPVPADNTLLRPQMRARVAFLAREQPKRDK
jgi:HlyD family secretion protein